MINYVSIHVLTVTISGRERGRSRGSQSRWVVLEKMKKSAPAQMERIVKKKMDNQIPLKNTDWSIENTYKIISFD